MESVARRVSSHLHSLGTTPDDIATSLQKLGIRGKPLKCDHCPIAKFLISKFPEAWQVLVDSSEISIIFLDQEERIDIDIDKTAISRFIERFDLKEYPNLIEKQ